MGRVVTHPPRANEALTIPCRECQLTKASDEPVLVVSLGYMPKP